MLFGQDRGVQNGDVEKEEGRTEGGLCFITSVVVVGKVCLQITCPVDFLSSKRDDFSSLTRM